MVFGLGCRPQHLQGKGAILMNNEEKMLQILTQMQTDIKDLKSDVKDLKSDVKNLKSDIKDLKSDMKKVDLNIKGLWEDIVKGENRLEKHEQKHHQYR